MKTATNKNSMNEQDKANQTAFAIFKHALTFNKTYREKVEQGTLTCKRIQNRHTNRDLQY